MVLKSGYILILISCVEKSFRTDQGEILMKVTYLISFLLWKGVGSRTFLHSSRNHIIIGWNYKFNK